MIFRLLCWAGWAVLAAAQSAAPQYALTAAASPVLYRIDLTIDPNLDHFDGDAEIDLRLREPAAELWLNARDLTIRQARVRAGSVSEDARTSLVGGEFLLLEFAHPLPAGRASVSIRYHGKLDDKALDGPYRRRVEGAWYVYTTFTAIEARRAFPCFDEPRFKTPWQLTLHIPPSDSAFSNSPVLGETAEGDRTKAVRFALTPPLPAEVVAFAVGPFDATDAARAGRNAIAVRTITPHGLAAQGAYASSVTGTVLARLEDYTAIPYPWAKLDHLALPEGAFGAVENPGLITYLSRSLLLAPASDSEEWRRSLRGLMTHELAH